MCVRAATSPQKQQQHPGGANFQKGRDWEWAGQAAVEKVPSLIELARKSPTKAFIPISTFVFVAIALV